jgi:hypothetical protein
MIWGALIKTALVRLGRAVSRAVVGEPAGDIPLDLTELARQAEDAMRPHGPREPSQPLSFKDVERQRAQAASAAHPMTRPETARPPPLPKPLSEAPPALAWTAPVLAEPAPFPATFPVTDVLDLPGGSSPFPDTLPPPSVLPAPLSEPAPPPLLTELLPEPLSPEPLSPGQRKADTVRPGTRAATRSAPRATPSRPPPPSPAMPRAAPRPLMPRPETRAAKRLPPRKPSGE